MKFINDFLENEKQKEVVITKDFPNGTKFFYKGETNRKVLHAWYKPLDDEQIDKLQTDVNNAQKEAFIFPEWYRDFFKTTNGLSIFFGSISFFGEQTPLVEDPVYGLIEAGIDGKNPNWMAPYSLRFEGFVRLDAEARSRWLTIGSYYYDHSNIVWDFKTNKIVVMYALPTSLSIKARKKMKEADYEQLIFAEWDSFETLFLSETKRLAKIFEFIDPRTVIYGNPIFWKRTLPVEHKDFIE
ncbi:MAG: hypothetical protein LBP62_00250 [Clostridiales bacterium]|nr:hypothetical protein [Clostridiales bacterium]